jgi:hypothetical protein
MGMTIRFTPSDCFDTLPKPHGIVNEELKRVGNEYNIHRSRIMNSAGIGLTQLYNQFHNTSERDVEIVLLREKQRSIDLAVLNAYGWSDIDLSHDFYIVPQLPESDNLRFIISETARIEVLRRLAELNRERYQEEVSQGLHGGNTARTESAPRQKVSAAASQPSFDFGDSNSIQLQIPITADRHLSYTSHATSILGFLTTRAGWHAKADILSAIGITDGQWNSAIADLIADRKVERQGERRGTRYRALRGDT